MTTTQKNKDLEVKILKQSLRFLSASKADDRLQMIEAILKHNGFSANYLNKHLKYFADSSLSIADLTDVIDSLARENKVKPTQQSKSASVMTPNTATSTDDTTNKIPSFVLVHNRNLAYANESSDSKIKSTSSNNKKPAFLVVKEHLDGF